ncbi:uncharacterized protein LOC119103135 [Pollicipes pollicipes]|uniref:uncharacterized protein LOC119103134 n=1 Tax=Pollicipes pollicipes TaxID=41117 RepID=UPI0018857432|nr:uncharacterized protein LOC119103134 [Pollicipes pollicipes]XP_037082481.1 uncharacterized protein LOC119103135 [Pollicipes pollicipes]
MSPQWLALCMMLVVGQASAFDDGDFGLKIEYDQEALNQSDAMLKDRSIATDHVLRDLHPNGLDSDLERQLEEANIADACPAGPKGLLCRRRFALRGADECAGDG